MELSLQAELLRRLYLHWEKKPLSVLEVQQGVAFSGIRKLLDIEVNSISTEVPVYNVAVCRKCGAVNYTNFSITSPFAKGCYNCRQFYQFPTETVRTVLSNMYCYNPVVSNFCFLPPELQAAFLKLMIDKG